MRTFSFFLNLQLFFLVSYTADGSVGYISGSLATIVTQLVSKSEAEKSCCSENPTENVCPDNEQDSGQLTVQYHAHYVTQIIPRLRHHFMRGVSHLSSTEPDL